MFIRICTTSHRSSFLSCVSLEFEEVPISSRLFCVCKSKASFVRSRHKHSSLNCDIRIKWWSLTAGIVVVCVPHQLGGLHGAGITISILDKRRAHRKRAVGQEDSCTLCFHFIPTPAQNAPGEIKGQGTGTLARSFSFFSLALFRGWKRTFLNHEE